MIVNNWPNNVNAGCLGIKEFFLSSFLTHEESLIDKDKIIIEKEGFFEDNA
jgi:hypothetical protein